MNETHADGPRPGSTDNDTQSRVYAYSLSPENQSTEASDGIRYFIDTLVERDLPESSNLTVVCCYSGHANEIRQLVSTGKVSKLVLVDLNIEKDLAQDLKALSPKSEMQVETVSGDVFSFLQHPSIESGSVSVMTAVGAEFLFSQRSTSLVKIAKALGTEPSELLKYHTETVVNSAYNLLPSGGLIFVDVFTALSTKLENDKRFVMILPNVFKKK